MIAAASLVQAGAASAVSTGYVTLSASVWSVLIPVFRTALAALKRSNKVLDRSPGEMLTAVVRLRLSPFVTEPMACSISRSTEVPPNGPRISTVPPERVSFWERHCSSAASISRLSFCASRIEWSHFCCSSLLSVRTSRFARSCTSCASASTSSRCSRSAMSSSRRMSVLPKSCHAGHGVTCRLRRTAAPSGGYPFRDSGARSGRLV